MIKSDQLFLNSFIIQTTSSKVWLKSEYTAHKPPLYLRPLPLDLKMYLGWLDHKWTTLKRVETTTTECDKTLLPSLKPLDDLVSFVV